ncbi:hypothetical protein C1I93_02365 [Micromonospora endophytica]|uniref:Uncharacterized protein n=1 Tax=Micromonospora endophytica TaxID=515350 RepID=A0A2W2CRC9_9ACTN|nr:hypothetical protein C1I93_02365 [Micromonospora endophytica]RIW46390.1 hypothetical protein D3H59_12175 [Micromonospora endophytica]BCJ57448.1 hypothetical protein Jiend_08700 [Micromonospora endophytica]
MNASTSYRIVEARVPVQNTTSLVRGRRRKLPRLTWLLQLFPVTTVVLAPYALLIVPMAVLNDNPDIGFIIMLLALALPGCLVVEFAFLKRMGRRGDWQRALVEANSGYPYLYKIARSAALVSVTADLLNAWAGQGTIFAQVTGEIVASPAALVSGLFMGWRYLAFALLVASLLAGQASRLACLRWTLCLLGTQLVVVLATALTAPLMTYLSFLVALAAICGLLHSRFIIVTALALFLIWPAMYEARNDLRTDGGVAVDETETSGDRLRLDLQVTRASGHDAPVDIERPGPSQIVRYGLVPRMLDQDRPAISTGIRINEYLGGTSTSAYTFLSLGTIYFLDGPWGVVLFHIGWALVGILLLRAGGAPGPIRLGLFSFVVAAPLMWSRTYPESMILFVQFVVAALPVLLLLRLGRRRSRVVPQGARSGT